MICLFYSIDLDNFQQSSKIRSKTTRQDSGRAIHKFSIQSSIALWSKDLNADLIDFQNAISTVPQSSLLQVGDDASMPLEVMHFGPPCPQFGGPLDRITPPLKSCFSGLLSCAVAISTPANDRPCHWQSSFFRKGNR